MNGFRENQADTLALSRSTLARMGLFVKNQAGTPLFVSRFWADLGYGEEDLQGDSWIDCLHPDDQEEARLLQADLLAGKRDHGRLICRVRSARGEWRWCVASAMLDGDFPAGEILYVGHVQDVTYLKELQREAEEARALAEERASEAESLRYAGAIIAASLDKREMVLRVAHQLRRLIPLEYSIVFERSGRELSALVDRETTLLPLAFFERGAGYDALLRCLRSALPEQFRDTETESRSWLAVPLVIRGGLEGVCALSRRDGEIFSEAEIRKALGIADFLALALNNGRLYEGMSVLATTDQLSGLANRHAFFLEAQIMLDESWRRGQTLSCLLIDLDFFKEINDTWGHLAGDQALREVAGAIKSCLRDDDLIGRYGGEEFSALLPGAGEEACRAAAERVRQKVRELQISSIGRRITCSVGVAVIPGDPAQDCPGLDVVLSLADEALYEAKKSGRDRVVLADTPWACGNSQKLS
ncbi:PAS domain S-box-containing protein/diguanylate cyclase (GGDEF) domain-containing protein [Alkalispirochaeta americana]|uniref:diguanylate cyclase n=1 Tax=Alkalispirochaeta americana TaxID=159291 RepID=A0A1N6T0Z9_9SPIO|nr:diguanylate cyclase [Alkalispirochaeta americana]SIQ47003.1 PAS domain S-box-containing protein/diguanylate cyclase (GGDEF) domain-containing protein [Alkalispirochaeta americana]